MTRIYRSWPLPSLLPDLAGRSIAVSGVGSAFGLAIARAFKEQGAHVFGCDVEASGLAAAAAIGIACVRVDLRDRDAARDWIDAIAAKASGLEILVNNAGGVAGQQQLPRPREGELRRQADRGPAGGEEGPLHLLHAEARALGRDAQIGALHQLHAARDGGAVDRGDHRLLDVEAAQQGLGAQLAILEKAAVELVGGLARLRHQRDQLAEVGARAEDVARAGDHDRANGIVVARLDIGVGEVAQKLRVEGVLHLGPVQGQDQNLAPHLFQQLGHFSPFDQAGVAARSSIRRASRSWRFILPVTDRGSSASSTKRTALGTL